MLEEKERECLSQLAENSMWASSAWWREGLTEMLRGLQVRGLVLCRNRDQQPVDPLDADDGAYRSITDAGREALKACS